MSARAIRVAVLATMLAVLIFFTSMTPRPAVAAVPSSASAVPVALIARLAYMPEPQEFAPVEVHKEAPAEPQEPEYVPDAAEVEALAKMLWGEARGVKSKTERAACVWCALNRVDHPDFPGTVLEVITEPGAFQGYDPGNPATDGLKALAADVLTRYNAEKNGDTNAGRVLPRDYLYFIGDGERNHFTTVFRGTDFFAWTLESPYEN